MAGTAGISSVRPWRIRVLVFGTAQGRNSLPQIARDLAAMRVVLTDERTGITYDENVTVIEEPTEASVRAAIRQPRWRRRDDLFVCYFSGHGSRDLYDQRLRLCMTDSHRKPRDPASFGMRYKDLERALSATRARHVLVILDCCHSGQAREDAKSVERFCVLASVQANRRTPQDPLRMLSPYTEALVAALRRPADGPVTAAVLSERLQTAFSNRVLPQGAGRTVDAREDEQLSAQDRAARAWRPCWSGTGGTIEVSRPDGWVKPPRTAVARRLRQADRHRRITAAIAIACVVACTMITIFLNRDQPASRCPPPLELRVLASLENEVAIAAAAASFESSPWAQRDPDEHDFAKCRRVNVTVYAAQTNQVVDAFATAVRWADGAAADGAAAGRPCVPAADPAAPADECAFPLRDVGPQPDIWIPDSTTELARAKQAVKPGTVWFGPPVPIASSPLVLGVPADTERQLTAASVEHEGTPWRRLVDAVAATEPAPRLLRPNPAVSGTGLVHTVALYLGYDGALGAGVTLPPARARELEAKFSAPGSSSGDSAELLCGQSRQPGAGDGRLLRDSAVLVSRKALEDFNEGRLHGSGCVTGAPLPAAGRLTGYQPAGVPDLDYPFVPITWGKRGDFTARDKARRWFQEWLLDSSGGGKELMANGFGPAAGLVAGAPAQDPARIDAALAAYQEARTPGRVQFLLDVSGSMDGGRLPQAVAAIKQSLDVLGPRDTYGIDTFPGPPGSGDGIRELVPMGTKDAAGGIRKLGTLRAQPRGEALYEAIGQGIDRLAPAAGKQPQLLVVITDGDHPTPDPDTPDASSTMPATARKANVPVVVLTLSGTECDPAVPSPLLALTTLSAGRCLNVPADPGRQLAGMVAAVAAGAE